MTTNAQKKSIYDFQISSIDGNVINFQDFKGKQILIVNVASECGYTPQYAGLEELYKKHIKNLVIIGVPSNDFGAQEPGSNKEIALFCKKNYGVTFPLTTKLYVTGEQQHELYQWLTQKDKNGVQESEVKWNFQKYLIDENGILKAVFPSSTDPNDVILTDFLKK